MNRVKDLYSYSQIRNIYNSLSLWERVRVRASHYCKITSQKILTHYYILPLIDTTQKIHPVDSAEFLVRSRFHKVPITMANSITVRIPPSRIILAANSTYPCESGS